MITDIFIFTIQAVKDHLIVDEKCVLSNCQWVQDVFTPCSSCKGKNAKMVVLQRYEWKKVNNAKMLVLQRQKCKKWSCYRGKNGKKKAYKRKNDRPAKVQEWT